MKQFPTADEAISEWVTTTPYPDNEVATFICPNCHAFTQHCWGAYFRPSLRRGARDIGNGPQIRTALCSACNSESVFFNNRLVYPSFGQAPPPANDLPAEISSEYSEAASILTLSPRGAAALLRLAIQKLCPVLGATKPDINAAIGELVASGKISPVIQKALDSVRVIGNESVHPGQMDLKDDIETAQSLFRLINFIVEKAITEPKQVAEIYDKLPANKLAGIAARDGNT